MPVSIIAIISIVAAIFYLGGRLIKISSQEIRSADNTFFDTAQLKLISLVESTELFLGVERLAEEGLLNHYFKNIDMFSSLAPTLDFVGNMLTMILMTAFFVILFLAGSINFQEVMQNVLFKQKFSSVKTFMKIEKDIIKFIWVKFVISFFTGVGFTFACIFFDVSFPVFWGLFAFLINFIQMVGSIISVILLSLFALVELDPTVTLVVFIAIITGVQVLMGSILEPVFLGKTFSINVITVLVMLMLWGFIWGVPGLIMAIPLTVFIKIVLEKFNGTQMIARLMSGR